NYQTTPDMPIWQAVRITMSFPGAFKAVDYNGEVFVDGGLKDNLPIQPVLDFETEPDAIHLRNHDKKEGVIGVSMETTEVIDFVQKGITPKDKSAAELGLSEWGK